MTPAKTTFLDETISSTSQQTDAIPASTVEASNTPPAIASVPGDRRTRRYRQRGMLLTDDQCRQTPPAAGRLSLRDGGRWTGLELRITDKGARTFSYRQRLKGEAHPNRITIGPYDRKGDGMRAFTLAQARDEALRIARENTRVPRKAITTGKTLNELFDAWHAAGVMGQTADGEACLPWSVGYAEQSEWYYERHVKSEYGSKPAKSLTPELVRSICTSVREAAKQRVWRGEKATGNVSVKRVQSFLSSMLNFAIVDGSYGITLNVAARPGRTARGRKRRLPDRDVYLPRELVGPFWREVLKLEQPYRDALQLVILLAPRIGMIGRTKGSAAPGLDWAWIDLEAATITWPGNVMKADRAHALPLPPQALAVLHARAIDLGDKPKSGPVFVYPDDQVAIADWMIRSRHGEVCKALGLSPTESVNPKCIGKGFTPHDWRRCASVYTADRFDEELRGRVLGHTKATITGAVYTPYDHLNAKRAVLTAWEEFVLNEAARGVVPFPAAKSRNGGAG